MFFEKVPHGKVSVPFDVNIDLGRDRKLLLEETCFVLLPYV